MFLQAFIINCNCPHEKAQGFGSIASTPFLSALFLFDSGWTKSEELGYIPQYEWTRLYSADDTITYPLEIHQQSLVPVGYQQLHSCGAYGEEYNYPLRRFLL
jgi:hypothetical protein